MRLGNSGGMHRRRRRRTTLQGGGRRFDLFEQSMSANEAKSSVAITHTITIDTGKNQADHKIGLSEKMVGILPVKFAASYKDSRFKW